MIRFGVFGRKSKDHCGLRLEHISATGLRALDMLLLQVGVDLTHGKWLV